MKLLYILSNLLEFISKYTSRFFAGFCGLAVSAAMLMIAANIFLRTFWNTWIPFTEEYTNYMMIGVTFLALSYTLREDAHIRINIIEEKLPLRYRPVLQFLQLAIALIASIFMLVYSYDFVIKAFYSGQKSSTVMLTPLWIPKATMVFGFIFLIIEILNMTLKKIFICLKEDIN